MTTTLRIGHGNGKNKATVVSFAKMARCDSFGFNEADRLHPAIGALPGYRMIAAPDAAPDRRAGETPTITRSSLEPLGELAVRVSERIAATERLTPDRWMTATMYAHPLATELGFYGVAHFNIHPDAGPAQLNGHDPERPTAREYGEAMQTAGTYLDLARREGFLRVLTGDLQMRARVDRPWAPMHVFTAANMATKTVGIDWIAYDKHLEVANLEISALFDHPGLIADLRARTRR